MQIRQILKKAGSVATAQRSRWASATLNSTLVANINDARCRDAPSGFQPDFVVTALDQLVSRQLIAAMPISLNAHYGILPQVKGWNATEWSLLEHGRLSVSLHRIAWPVDSGEIYLT
jgi:methionyl-tRNA formyltransferase